MNISKAETTNGARSAHMSALEKLPHITKRVCLLWGHPEFDAFTSHLLMDSRDGKRQGLPWEVAPEPDEHQEAAPQEELAHPAVRIVCLS